MDVKKADTRVCGMLGFAMRAGRLVLGTEQILTAMARSAQSKRPRLVLICENISGATTKKLTSKAAMHGVPCMTLPMEPSDLGDLLGKTYAPVAVAVMDDGFAKQLRIRLGELGIDAQSPTQDKISLRKEVSEKKETGMTDGAN